MLSSSETHRAAATRFIEAFNTNNWEAVGEVVAPDFTLHHPMAGTRQIGPEGMVSVWAHFKAALPDAWHPIPVMITEGEYLANLLPTYGHFTGEPHQGTPPTGEWLEYGMVNIVRFEAGLLAEAWFGMDPWAEMQQMATAPKTPQRRLTDFERMNVERFQTRVRATGSEYETVTAFGDMVVAIGPLQQNRDAKTRRRDVYHASGTSLTLVDSHEFPTVPPYRGDLGADTAESRAVVDRFFNEVLLGHSVGGLDDFVSEHILVHATAMPCEASRYGWDGVVAWLGEQWRAFPDLAVTKHVTVASGDIVAAQWVASGTSEGEFLHLPPTGERVEFTGVSMYRVAHGRLSEIWETRDTLGVMRQLNADVASSHAHARS